MEPHIFEVDVTDQIAEMARSHSAATGQNLDSAQSGSATVNHNLDSESQTL